MGDRRLVLLLVAGLVVRLAGILFNGMGDLYQILLEWGFAVVHEGLVDAFAINYGIFSYALFGLAAWAAELVPRFWWAPYKLVILAFDIGVLVALLKIAPTRSLTIVALYWLNPWFILHQAYHGFWEAPHIFFGLLAVLAVRHDSRPEQKWAAAGALLACSAMFKPQGLIHFIGPLGLYLAVEALRSDRKPLAWFVAGCATVFASLALTIAAAGGPPRALLDNYRSAFVTMPGISNGGPGIWRFVSFLYMTATGQDQTIPFVKIPRMTIAVASGVAAIASMGILTLFAWRRRLTDEPARLVLMILALGSLVMAQFGVRAHINHSYTAMVLLVPIAASSTAMRRLWVAMCALLGVSHVLAFGLGHAALLPPAGILYRYSAAHDLIGAVTALPAYAVPDWPLRTQLWVKGVLEIVPGETIVSMLSIAVFALACLMVREIFIESRSAPS
jgi:hypothetical protein